MSVDLVTFAPSVRAVARTAHPIAGLGIGRRIALIAVHHVFAEGINYCGGAEKYIQTTIAALLDSGASVHVGYSGSSVYEALLETCEPDRLTIERTDWLDANLAGDARLSVGGILERRRWLKATGADTLLAVQQAGGASFVYSLVAARLAGLRVVSSIRQPPLSTSAPPRKGGLSILRPQLWRRRVQWRRGVVARCSHALIFNSQTVARSYHDGYGWSLRRAQVIPNGEVLRARSPSAAPLRIAAVGRVTRAKGSELLLEAFAKIARDHLDASLTYFGDGPLIQPLRDRAASLGLARRVRFAGHIPDRDRIYEQVDILVQPSRREAMSNSVLEAMARGIPCIVSDVGGLPEMIEIGRSGLVFASGDTATLAAAMHSLLGDPMLCEEMGRSAQRRVQERFGIEETRYQTIKTILG